MARRLGWWWLLLPVMALLVPFFLVPLLQLLQLSLLAERPSPASPAPSVTLSHYVSILLDAFYWRMLLNSLSLGICTTLGTLLVGYPVAYYLTRISGWERTLISVACLLPLFVNIIVGVLGWYILLLPFGVAQQAMASLGLVTGPVQILRTFPALAGVLVYEHLPFAVLILVASLQGVPRDKVDAARLLGAGTLRICWDLILPLTMPGLVACAILVFCLSTSSYLTPILIGAQRIPVVPLAIFSYGTELLNWPMAAALSFVLMVAVGAIAYGFAALMNRVSKRGAWEMV